MSLLAAGSSSAAEAAVGSQDGPAAPAGSRAPVEKVGGVEASKRDVKKKRSIRLRRNRQSREGGFTGGCIILADGLTPHCNSCIHICMQVNEGVQPSANVVH